VTAPGDPPGSRAARGERLYRSLLRALPKSFRERHGEEMGADYHALASERRGVPARARLWLGLLADLALLLARAWVAAATTAFGPREDRAASGNERSSERHPRAAAFARDLGAALRQLRRRPALAAAAVGTLALGLGAASTIFGFVDGVLLRAFSYHDPDRLVALFQDEGRDDGRYPASPAAFLAWREREEGIAQLTAARPFTPVLSVDGAPARRLEGLLATPELFALLGVPPLHGATFGPASAAGAEGQAKVVVLGYGLWQRELGGRADVVGSTVRLDGEPYRVLGVMPPGFRFPPFWATGAELWTPLLFRPQDAEWGARFLRVFGRLEPGVELDQVVASYRALGDSLAAARPELHAGTTIRVEPLREPALSEIRPVLLGLLGAAGLLLLLVCANVAGLLVCRAVERGSELAVRSALGASRRRLVAQFLVEAGVLCALGGAAGVALAAVALPLVKRLFAASLPVTAVVGLDGRTIAVALALAFACAPAFGLAAALGAPARRVATALRGGRAVGLPRRALRSVLVTLQVALAVTLLSGAGLLVRTVRELLRHDPGFRTDRVVALQLALSGSPHRPVERRAELLGPLLDQVRAMPGVEAAGVVYHLPVGGDLWQVPFRAAEAPVPEPGEEERAAMRIADAGYAGAIGLRLLRGRWLESTDVAGAEPVVAVNETLARRNFAGADAVGRQVQIADWPLATIVGVYADADQETVASAILPEIYFPTTQDPTPWNDDLTLVVRGPDEAGPVAAEVRRLLARLDPDVAVHSEQTLEQVHSEQLARQRASTLLLASFGGCALLLSALGLFALMAELQARRRGEMGLRLALGAGRRRILALVARDAMRIAAPGIAAGVVGSVALGRALEHQLYGVEPADPATLVAIGLLVFATAIASVVVPARRAAGVDPASSLRAE
jgi:putative ABC transport system permease protein